MTSVQNGSAIVFGGAGGLGEGCVRALARDWPAVGIAYRSSRDRAEAIAPDEWAATRAVLKGETTLNEAVDIETFDGARKTVLNSAVPLRSLTGLPLYAGFGISTPADAAAAAEVADGIVVGSRAIEVATDGPAALCDYVSSLREAVDSASPVSS